MPASEPPAPPPAALPSAPIASVERASTAAPSAVASAAATEEISIPADGRGAALGLAIEVLENVEKRDMDGSELMRIGLRLRAAGREEEVWLSSPGREALTWGGYHLRYRGGWRKQVDLTVTRVAP